MAKPPADRLAHVAPSNCQMIRLIAVAAVALLSLAPRMASAQPPKPISNPAEAAESELIADGAEEARRGTWLFYSEAYLDSENRRAVYQGSIYGDLQDLQIKGCVINAKVLLVDLFSGSAGKKHYQDAQDADSWTISFRLSPPSLPRLPFARLAPRSSPPTPTPAALPTSPARSPGCASHPPVSA